MLQLLFDVLSKKDHHKHQNMGDTDGNPEQNKNGGKNGDRGHEFIGTPKPGYMIHTGHNRERTRVMCFTGKCNQI